MAFRAARGSPGEVVKCIETSEELLYYRSNGTCPAGRTHSTVAHGLPKRLLLILTSSHSKRSIHLARGQQLSMLALLL